MGMPATHTLSLIATRLPASAPDGAPLIEHLQYHALKGFSSGAGRYPVVRGYWTGNFGSRSSSTRRYDTIASSMRFRYAARSSSVSRMW